MIPYAALHARTALRSELEEVEANLRFWQRREAHGNHFWFTLLRRVSPPLVSSSWQQTMRSAGARPLPTTNL